MEQFQPSSYLEALGLNGSYHGHFTTLSVPPSPCLCKRFYFHVRTVPRSGIVPEKCVTVTVSGSKPKVGDTSHLS